MKLLKKSVLGLLFILAGCSSSLQPQLLPLNEIPTQPVNVSQAPAKSSNFFPTDPDFVWEYDVVFHPVNDPYVDYKGNYTVRVEKAEKNKNQTILTLRAIDSIYNKFHFPEIIMDNNNISIKGINYFGFGSTPAEDLTIDFLHLPLKVGNNWDDGLWTGKVKAVEKISVPAGNYADAWKIDSIGTYNQEYTAVGNYWVVPGVGIVKSELTVPGWHVESSLVFSGIKKK